MDMSDTKIVGMVKGSFGLLMKSKEWPPLKVKIMVSTSSSPLDGVPLDIPVIQKVGAPPPLKLIVK